MASCRRNLVRAAALFLGVATLAFACIGFGTNNWLEFDVDREDLPIEQFYLSRTNVELGRIMFTRHRGIFRECYSDDNVQFLDVTDDEVDSDCFELDFDDPDDVDVSDDYSTRLELLRCVISFFVIGIVCALATLVVAIISICKRKLRWVVLSCLFALFTGLFIVTAIAFFLGVDHMEREDRGDRNELIFRKNWPTELDDATSTTFGWSFALSWVAVGLAFLSAVLYLVIALRMRNSQDDDFSDTSSESDASDKPSVSRRRQAADYSRTSGPTNPYAINEAYQGSLNPVYWPYDNKARPPRRALQLAVPADYSSHPGPFFYGAGAGFLPAINVVRSPAETGQGGGHSRSSSRKE